MTPRAAGTGAGDVSVTAAHFYLLRGWQPVPIPPGQKGPIIDGWPDLQVTEQNVEELFTGQFIGLRTGTISHGLTDMDIDGDEALAVADAFLPATGMVSGRASSLRSHRWYIGSPAPHLLQLKDPIREKTDLGNAMLVELRGDPKNESATCIQTLAPPSRHPSGELLAFENGCRPASCTAEDLISAAKNLAVTALLARYWPKSEGEIHGHDLVLAAAGAFGRAGVPLETVRKILESAARVAGYQRFKAADVDDSFRNLQNGAHVTGWPRLHELLGEAITNRIGAWLGYTFTNQGTRIGAAPGQSGGGFNLTSLGDLLNEPPESVSWLVEGKLPLAESLS